MEELRARLILTVAAINPRMVHALITDSASGPGAKGSAVMALERGNLTDRVRQLAADKKTLLEVDRSMKRAEELGARWLMPGDEEFPEELTDTPLLSIRGSWHRGTSVGIVGSREADEYGRTVARSLARALATVRISVVSGAARGIDEAAHLGALDIVNGHTVAVLGTGLAGDRNPRKRQLLDKIAEQGAVISEYSTEYRGSPFSFPQRNRLIARLSKAVVVAQAFEKSGALNTAKHAREFGRPVLAVPGDVLYPLSAGPNSLIARGHAKILTHPRDLADPTGAMSLRRADFPSGIRSGAVPDIQPLDGELSPRAQILGALLGGPRSFGDLDKLVGPEGRVAELLLTLEMEGRVRLGAGNQYERV